ncbi:efflux RND transporter periplasmic adaptor subunit [Mariniblastus fucicola]|uniref:Peptidase family M50 n=1 Tax=Mariniblastus fucicola TaxID=980251 RepID=A0A5B9PPX1_9BACT|nr:efflux RND transporter periplasmic adaptor subunit [Mariniblastus fucicola]QEG24333.1 Peptidase family M50 [Mariniblastus fucicola]
MLQDSTLEFGQARLKLKESLRFDMRQSGNSVSWICEDEVTGRFFQLGLPQYTFLTMLDGQRTVSTALMKTATLLREHAIEESEAANVCKWAIESGLVETESGNSAARRKEQHQQIQKQQLVSWLNPMMIRIPLFDPDQMIEKAAKLFGFLVSPMGFLLWLVVVIAGFFQLLMNWDQFFVNRVSSFSASDLLWIALTSLVLKLIHEVAHGVVCKKFGGRVKSCGILVLLLIPMPFVDVTSSWRFPSKWQRILTSAAGMISEIFIAAIACLVWASSSPGPLQYHAGNVIITATLLTLLFNVNPLMRFDGYYMLSDWLEIPNLSTHGRQWLKGAFKRLFFGSQKPTVKETGFRGFFVKTYGVLAMMWFFSIAVGLSLGASSLLEGFGLIIAIIGLLLWIGVPVWKLAKYVIHGTETENPNRVWFATASAITAACLVGFLMLCPAPSVVSAPIVIDYDPLTVVRAKASGFANTIHVTDGQWVEAGDLLMTLENPELQLDLTSLLIDLRISTIRAQALLTREQLGELKLENEAIESMHKRRRELEEQIANLNVVATQSGTVLAADLHADTGKYFRPGDEILSIGNDEKIHAIALTRQQDIEWIEQRDAVEVELRIWGRSEDELIAGQIKHVHPRARDDLPHEAFAATAGGPLAVVPREQVEDSSESNNGEMKLTEPRVPLEIELARSDRQTLLPGQAGQILVRAREQNMGTYLAQNFVRFVKRNNLRTHGL